MSKNIAYRIVSYSTEHGYKTIYGNKPLDLEIGKTTTMPGNGLYLSPSKEFCLDFYTGLTDDTDVLLTYSYDPSDIITGQASGYGEFSVRKAKLVDIEFLTDS